MPIAGPYQTETLERPLHVASMNVRNRRYAFCKNLVRAEAPSHLGQLIAEGAILALITLQASLGWLV